MNCKNVYLLTRHIFTCFKPVGFQNKRVFFEKTLTFCIIFILLQRINSISRIQELNRRRSEHKLIRIQNVKQIQRPRCQHPQRSNVLLDFSTFSSTSVIKNIAFSLGSNPHLFIAAKYSLSFGFSNFSLNSSTTIAPPSADAALDIASFFSFLLILIDQSLGLGPNTTPPPGDVMAFSEILASRYQFSSARKV